MGKKETVRKGVDFLLEEGKNLTDTVGTEKQKAMMEAILNIKRDLETLESILNDGAGGVEKEERIVLLLEFVQEKNTLDTDSFYMKSKELGWDDRRALNPLFKTPGNSLTKVWADGQEKVAVTEVGFKRIRKWRSASIM